VPEWKFGGNRRLDVTVTTPQDTGAGDFKTIASLMQLNMYLATERPGYKPWSEAGMASSRTRHDSAGAKLGAGPWHGAVFTDHVPTLTFDMRAGSNHRQAARHIHDALNNPRLTFPSINAKSVPGKTKQRPLRRLMKADENDKNGAEAIKVCRDIWGTEYAKGGIECDEFPFRRTYEGAWKSTGGDWQKWQGSSRPIKAEDNSEAGKLIGLFYGEHRILDSDAFLVDVQR